MWVPRDAQEVEEVLSRGDLEETASFDGKLALPAPKKNIDIAIDVAAMTTEGGSLLYGVGEDDNGRLTISNPIPLAGSAERISQIVATSIAEVPYMEVTELPLSADDPRGYLSVLVPQSARAPHQVIVGDDKRFYGRGAKGNRRLSEGEVARLYRRRMEWDQDLNELLAQAVAQAPFASSNELAYLHGFVRPVAPDRGIWDRAVSAAGGQQELLEHLREAAAETTPRNRYDPDLGRATTWRRRGADEWVLSSIYSSQNVDHPDFADSTVDARINVDGRGHLFCGRAAQTLNRRQIPDDEGDLVIFEDLMAGNTAAFLAVFGCLYALGDYHGQVDLGLSVTGLRGGHTSTRLGQPFPFRDREPFGADVFPRTERVAAGTLREPKHLVRDMLRHLFEATTGRDDFDPFSD